jgi:hypothetical protein
MKLVIYPSRFQDFDSQKLVVKTVNRFTSVDELEKIDLGDGVNQGRHTSVPS